MNSKLLYILWKSVLSRIIQYNSVWYVFTFGWKGGIVRDSAKIDLRQSCLYDVWIKQLGFGY